MDIADFISKFQNHPVLFVGAGMSLRYLNNSYTWEGLLKTVAASFNNSDEYFWDLKADHKTCNGYDFAAIASVLERDFDTFLKGNRDGKFKEINDQFYSLVREGRNVTRFKLYISNLLKDIDFKNSETAELEELQKIKKNIISVVTTNYDCMMDQLFEFHPLIGNAILLSNPYGAIYKIHGCVSDPEKIIITSEDYKKFKDKYVLIRAQLLSLFIHHPIIFIGYSITDPNIREILTSIFSCVDYHSDEGKKIRDNFLLIEHAKGETNTTVSDHDIDIDGIPTIRINKIKTDNYIAIYKALSGLMLPVSAMDIRKVENVMRTIRAGGEFKVSISEDLDQLDNSDKILVIGSKQRIQYIVSSVSELIENYFNIIDSKDSEILPSLNKLTISKRQYFPIFGFSKLCSNIKNLSQLKKQQKERIDKITGTKHPSVTGSHKTPQDVLQDAQMPRSWHTTEIVKSIMNHNMDLDVVKEFLKNYPKKNSTDYKKMLCAYDLSAYP